MIEVLIPTSSIVYLLQSIDSNMNKHEQPQCLTFLYINQMVYESAETPACDHTIPFTDAQIVPLRLSYQKIDSLMKKLMEEQRMCYGCIYNKSSPQMKKLCKQIQQSSRGNVNFLFHPYKLLSDFAIQMHERQICNFPLLNRKITQYIPFEQQEDQSEHQLLDEELQMIIEEAQSLKEEKQFKEQGQFEDLELDEQLQMIIEGVQPNNEQPNQKQQPKELCKSWEQTDNDEKTNPAKTGQ